MLNCTYTVAISNVRKINTGVYVLRGSTPVHLILTVCDWLCLMKIPVITI